MSVTAGSRVAALQSAPEALPFDAPLLLRDPALEPIADKVLEGKRLSLEDGITLYHTRDVPALMRLADHVRRQKVGDKAYYVHSLRL